MTVAVVVLAVLIGLIHLMSSPPELMYHWR